MKKQCTGCAVSAGTHQPAEALHHQIDEPQAEALLLADECEESAAHWALEIDTRLKAAKMLRDQHSSIADIEAQHREELRAYEITVANREARIAELESQLEAVGAGGVEPLRKQAAQAVALQALRTIAEYPATDLMMNMDAANMRLIAEQALSAANPAAQGIAEKLIDFIEEAGDVRLSRCRIWSITGPVRWDVEFGHDDAVRGRTLQDAIAKAIVAQAKQGVQAND